MSKPSKELRECRSTARNTASSTANSETDAKTMETLTKAVNAIQASIDSFRKENRASIASLQTTLNALSQRITSVEEGVNELDKRMDCVELAQATLTKKNGVLRDKIMYLENYTRRHNI